MNAQSEQPSAAQPAAGKPGGRQRPEIPLAEFAAFTDHLSKVMGAAALREIAGAHLPREARGPASQQVCMTYAAALATATVFARAVKEGFGQEMLDDMDRVAFEAAQRIEKRVETIGALTRAVRSAVESVLGAPAEKEPAPAAPPADNAHVAPGSEPFSPETIAAAAPPAPCGGLTAEELHRAVDAHLDAGGTVVLEQPRDGGPPIAHPALEAAAAPAPAASA